MAAPPRWDLSPMFSSIDSPQYRDAVSKVLGDLKSLETAFEGKEDTAASLTAILDRYNAIRVDANVIRAYLHARVSTDATDAEAQAAESDLRGKMIGLQKFSTRFAAWVGTLDLEAFFAQSEMLAAHRYGLEKMKVQATHLMSPAEESLAADLNLTGASAWDKLYGDVSSQIEVQIDGKGHPMSVVRAFAYDPDREVRRTAYHAELAAWKRNEVPLAAAMNSIKGQVSLLCKRRGWGSPLDEALFHNNIDKATLDAMLQAARDSFPDLRRYMHAKARGLGLQRLAFYDIFAPIGTEAKAWSYEEASEFVADQFGAYSPKMRDYANRNYAEHWIDAEPRAGKRDGAYCMGIKDDVSRIMMNFKPSFGSVSTLAHELGHGYHNLCLSGRTSVQRETPSTLAETASIFCETIIRQAALKTGTDSEKIAILEASLQGATQVVADITSRFLFESEVFEKRAERELSAAELCDIMRRAQLATYGDGLDAEQLHPYMWAAKPHYYDVDSFYNFPYMFGLLFALGLYGLYREDPESFKGRYDELLSSTGLADAATLARGFGIDLRSPAFWNSSFDQIRADVDRFEALVGSGGS